MVTGKGLVMKRTHRVMIPAIILKLINMRSKNKKDSTSYMYPNPYNTHLYITVVVTSMTAVPRVHQDCIKAIHHRVS